MNPQLFAYALLAFPLISAAAIAFGMRRNGALASGVSVGAAALILATAGHIIFRLENFEFSSNWIQLGPLSLDFGFLVDDLAKLMLFVVAFVGFLVHVFSLGYMKEDPNKARFFGGLSIFMFSMLGLVMANSLVTLFIFWELVGFSSYMLIGFYLDKPSAAAASKKAFIANRVGDFGFLIGIAMAIGLFGTVSLTEMRELVVSGEVVVGTAALGLLLFCGTVGKSGQIPLHVWLPDAMEGPTPVSALIHAATMVAAGVFLLCRTGFLMTADALNVIMWVGVATAIYAGLTAIAQRDIKKILAYSTVSQLGYMVAAFGLGSLVALKDNPGDAASAVVTGGVAAAMFHLTTHAFFKALLFLGSGSIIHACHHEQDIFKMGGLMKKMPVTFACFTLGLAALVGTPYLSGYFSKDAILALAVEENMTVFYLLVFGAFLTTFYMVRLWKIVFLGKANSENAKHAHENGLVMTVPLMLLAALAVLGGYAGIYPEAMAPLVDMGDAIAHGEHHGTVMVHGIGAWIVGLALAWVVYGAGAKEDRFGGPAYAVLQKKFFFDEVYDFYIAKIQQRVALTLHFFEQIALSGLIIRGAAGVAGLIGIGLKSLHVGSLHQYVYWFIAGLAIFWFIAG
ncbi:NADH-quinone oxidoreductase subunit L [Pelagicoccus sp. SDUM812005]|uniref:NADH-quinone oxidoreductase subunit 5 family protein n=1 Tax=Pelagicoccus sp. SDUM812005 TaxID=3041257 RepID=UPI00280CD2F8|nr:NADH-quinone oxidoreductase subunit L [Pelagicoccus sp. SDUM812005]MDQ8181945.1 NADH-quinone oxidoreductase subunit L [Pelagicoccus sp. SDUM812005]